MKRITLSEWEKKYITRPIQRFDQKNRAHMRAEWDPEYGKRLGQWTAEAKIEDRPGYTLEDMALGGHGAVGEWRRTYAVTTFEEAVERSKIPSRPDKRRKTDVSNPQRIARNIKKAATWYGADLVGVCRFDRRWVYSHSYKRVAPHGGSYPKTGVGESKPIEIPEEYQYAVAMAVNQDYNVIKYSPSHISSASNGFAYGRLVSALAYLAAFIQNLGFKAVALPTHHVVLQIPIAMQAGLGEQGRNGLLITPEFGPRVKIGSLVTDLPLVADLPIDFGVTEFCTTCKQCARMCPAQALPYGDRSAEPNNASNNAGELKWRVNAEECGLYWAHVRGGCMVCVASCPYNKMDESLAYSKPIEADNFWEEWQPVPYAASGLQSWNR